MKFEEAKYLQCACIYKLTYPDGKCYIGQTKCLHDRMKLYFCIPSFFLNPLPVFSCFSGWGFYIFLVS